MKVEELKELISTDDIKNHLPEDLLESLTFNSEMGEADDSVIERAINIASQKLFIKLKKCGKKELTEDEKGIAKLYLLKDAIYQLYAMNETEKVSADKLQEARQGAGAALRCAARRSRPRLCRLARRTLRRTAARPQSPLPRGPYLHVGLHQRLRRLLPHPTSQPRRRLRGELGRDHAHRAARRRGDDRCGAGDTVRRHHKRLALCVYTGYSCSGPSHCLRDNPRGIPRACGQRAEWTPDLYYDADRSQECLV